MSDSDCGIDGHFEDELFTCIKCFVDEVANDELNRIVDLVEHSLVNDEQHIPRLCEGCQFIARIKGETND